MPKRITPITDIQIRNTKPKEKQFGIFDGGGLYLLVTPSGGKLWKFKYRFEGKGKLLSFGSYPEVSIRTAREKRDEARGDIANGIDPGEKKKLQQEDLKRQTENTFENIAREWFLKFSQTWAKETAQKKIRRLESNVFPVLGLMPVDEIRTHDIMAMLRTMEERGVVDLAHRVKLSCSQVFRESENTNLPLMV